MVRRNLLLAALIVLVITQIGCSPAQKADPYGGWNVHDMKRPQPVIVAPGSENSSPPSDALVLFDGTDLSNWQRDNGKEPKWKVENGHMEVTEGKGSLRTKRVFGDCQLHVEWATPSRAEGKGQSRGNSGIYLMSKYEVQVLDSYANVTYPDGQAASIYGQSPPLVNASRGPGQWQSYDVIFRRPIFDDDKELIRPATFTVLQNGVLVQDHWVVLGPSQHEKQASYVWHEDKLPIFLQNHGDPVRYRKIWIRELPEK